MAWYGWHMLCGWIKTDHVLVEHPTSDDGWVDPAYWLGYESKTTIPEFWAWTSHPAVEAISMLWDVMGTRMYTVLTTSGLDLDPAGYAGCHSGRPPALSAWLSALHDFFSERSLEFRSWNHLNSFESNSILLEMPPQESEDRRTS